MLHNLPHGDTLSGFEFQRDKLWTSNFYLPFELKIKYLWARTFAKMYIIYNWLLLSRPHLSRITAYLKVKIWSLPKDENLTTGNKILWKREEIAPLYHNIFQYISNFKSPITYTFLKCGCSIYFILNSAILICRGTNISKYFRESPGIRDNESWLYMEESMTVSIFTTQCHDTYAASSRVKVTTVWRCGWEPFTGSGPSCSKLTTSLVNYSLKFKSSDTRICWNFLLKKCE